MKNSRRNKIIVVATFITVRGIVIVIFKSKTIYKKNLRKKN